MYIRGGKTLKRTHSKIDVAKTVVSQKSTPVFVFLLFVILNRSTVQLSALVIRKFYVCD